MSILVRQENETKNEYEKRIKLMKKASSVYDVHGDNEAAKVEIGVLVKVASDKVSLHDKHTYFRATNPKAAKKEVERVLKYVLKGYSAYAKDVEEALKGYKFRGHKDFKVGEYNVEILCTKL